MMRPLSDGETVSSGLPVSGWPLITKSSCLTDALYTRVPTGSQKVRRMPGPSRNAKALFSRSPGRYVMMVNLRKCQLLLRRPMDTKPASAHCWLCACSSMAAIIKNSSTGIRVLAFICVVFTAKKESRTQRSASKQDLGLVYFVSNYCAGGANYPSHLLPDLYTCLI